MISHGMALILLIIVAVAMCIAIVSYITTLWARWPQKALEAVEVLGDSYYSVSDNSVYLHLYTNYKPYVLIYRIKLGDLDLDIGSAKILRIEKGKASVENGSIKLVAGTVVWIRVPVPEGAYSGSLYIEVRLYTTQGYVYRGVLRVES